MRRFTILAALAVTLPLSAAAQPVPGDVFPLDEGNRWVYVRSTSSFNPSSGSSSSTVGAEEWLVDGTAEVGGETLPLLRITPTPGNTTLVCAVGAEVDGDVVSFPFLNPETGEDCGYQLNYLDGSVVRSGVQVDVSDTVLDEFEVGGRSYGEVPAYRGQFFPPGPMESGFYGVRVGVGVTFVSITDEFGPGSRSRAIGLRRAEVGGEVFGAPLNPGDNFFPFGVGDAWTFEVERGTSTGTFEPDGFVLWGIVERDSGPVLLVDRVLDGERTLLGECGITTVPASASNGFRLTVNFVDTANATCPADRGDALPALDPRGTMGMVNGRPGVVVGAFDEATVTVGATPVTTDVAAGHVGYTTPNSLSVSDWQTARFLGVVSFGVRQEGPGFAGWRANAAYVRVGGVEYGANPVAGESAPDASTLSLAVGPNPARASARLFIGGDAAVRVTVLDALGRVVETREATPGALSLDTSRWAAGVYTVRAESADGVAWTRLTVAR